MASKSTDGSRSPTNEIELIEVDEDWVQRNIKNSKEFEGYGSDIELIEVGEEWVDKNIEDSDKSSCDGNNDQPSGIGECYVELIEVGEEWVDENIEDSDNIYACVNDVDLMEIEQDYADGNIEERSNSSEANSVVIGTDEFEKSGFSVEKLGTVHQSVCHCSLVTGKFDFPNSIWYHRKT